MSSKASVQKIYNFPERGYLYDRNNKLIVSNQPYYDLLIVPNDVNINDSIKIANDLGISVKDFNTKYKKARKFSPLKASIFISSHQRRICQNSRKNVEIKWLFCSKKF